MFLRTENPILISNRTNETVYRYVGDTQDFNQQVFAKLAGTYLEVVSLK